jgi:hypothetical protein
MIRIVGVQRSADVRQEFVLLQNQGNMRARLRGHVVMSDVGIAQGTFKNAAHVFSDDEWIHTGQYVALYTGLGLPHWGRSRDGAHVYFAYIGSDRPIWNNCEGPIHILAPHHTYVERTELVSVR